jgi:ankyrin repeat protein
MTAKYQGFPGMEDILPGEIEKWQWVEEKARAFFEAGGFKEIVSLLIAKGVRVNEKNTKGHTALMLAAAHGEEAVVKLLLDNKADVDLADRSNHTALMYAINGNHEDVVKTLMEKGAKTKYRDRSGMTPAALASSKRNPQLVTLLTATSPAP